MPKSIPISLAFALAALCIASPAAAFLNCNDCGCSYSCSQVCYPDTGPATTCGALGACSGSSGCGGGCLTASQLEAFLASLGDEPAQATPAEQRRARVAARLTWRLTQHAEESGLGAVYAGPAGFRLAGPRGRAQAPDIAFVRGGAASGIPDLVVELGGPRARARAAGWLASGTGAVLLVDPEERTVRLYRSGADARLLRGDDVLELPELLPGWSLRAGDLFE